MKQFGKKYRHLISLCAIVVMAAALIFLGDAMKINTVPDAIMLVAGWQLFEFATSKGYRRGHLFAPALTDEQVKEFDDILKSFKGFDSMFKELADIAKSEGGFAAIKKLPELLKAEQERGNKLETEVKKLRKQLLSGGDGSRIRWVGNVPWVSDDCAKALGSMYVLSAQAQGRLEGFIKDASRRDALVRSSYEALGIEIKDATGGLTTADIPLPVQYIQQVIELIYAFGQFRQYATVFPLGAATANLPRLKAGEDKFGPIAMAAALAKKKVSAENVLFTAHKEGGIIGIPTEIEEDTLIMLGQFIARYISRRFAEWEDECGFLGDGSANYDTMKGVGPYIATTANTPQLKQLANGKTKPSDSTLADWRAMRGKVNAEILRRGSGCYYCNPTMDTLFVTFNTIGQPLVYIRAQGGQPATLDGFPIRWVGVMQAYSENAAASAFLGFFGDLSYWFLGERGQPRVETSREVYFENDMIAIRAIERFDVEAMAIDAMAALQTAAQ